MRVNFDVIVMVFAAEVIGLVWFLFGSGFL